MCFAAFAIAWEVPRRGGKEVCVKIFFALIAVFAAICLGGMTAAQDKQDQKKTAPAAYILVLEDGWNTRRTVVEIVGLKVEAEKELKVAKEGDRYVIEKRRIYLGNP